MNFDRLAPHYDWMEAFTAGERLQRARVVWLNELLGRRRVLSAGEGHGRFAAACAVRFPGAELTCVESSPRMMARAQARCRKLPGAIHWQCTDVLNWKSDGQYDALVTCFFLDCFAPDRLAEVVARLADCATPDAVWLVVDFTVPARGLARWRAHAVHTLMYTFFRIVTNLPARKLTPPGDLLQTHGFRLRRRQEFNWGLFSAELWTRE